MAAKPAVESVEGVFQLDPDAPPYQRYRDRPSGILVDEVAEHVRRTAQPETFPKLYRGKLPSSARHHILRKIEIDQKKRPEGDRAPCPMCTPNRFLNGFLVWLPELHVASVIGHCCADHADDAEREFKAREKLNKQEDYLLASLPLLKGKIATLIPLKGAANDASLLYRSLRAKVPGVQLQLRHLKDRSNAVLRLTETITDANGLEVKGYGPSGYRRGEVLTRDVEFGQMRGTTALIRNYRPAVELEDAIRTANSFDFDGDEETALNIIADMSLKQRVAAVRIVQMVDSYYEKFIGRLRDFAEFWSTENIKNLNAFGSSPLNPTPFEARRLVNHRRPTVVIRQEGKEFRMLIPDRMMQLDREWKVFSYKK